NSVTYQRIKKNRELIYRNYNLVRLPFPGMAPIQLTEDRFDEKIALQTFDDLGFRSFLESKNKDRWRSFFSGGRSGGDERRAP
ncbi:MAG TPA: hypothetical protein PK082_11010, partial [Phycisphaerae bacterium]|nr:hypothetical protein [Phycisphaerae bacterium]